MCFMFVCLVCSSEFYRILFIIPSEESQIRIIKLDITAAISASESSFCPRLTVYFAESMSGQRQSDSQKSYELRRLV